MIALVARADAARVAGDGAARATAIDDALAVAGPAAARAPKNAHLPGYVAELHAARAELAATPAAARAEWEAAWSALQPLAGAARLPAGRRALFDRAAAQLR